MAGRNVSERRTDDACCRRSDREVFRLTLDHNVNMGFMPRSRRRVICLTYISRRLRSSAIKLKPEATRILEPQPRIVLSPGKKNGSELSYRIITCYTRRGQK